MRALFPGHNPTNQTLEEKMMSTKCHGVCVRVTVGRITDVMGEQVGVRVGVNVVFHARQLHVWYTVELWWQWRMLTMSVQLSLTIDQLTETCFSCGDFSFYRQVRSDCQLFYCYCACMAVHGWYSFCLRFDTFFFFFLNIWLCIL